MCTVRVALPSLGWVIEIIAIEEGRGTVMMLLYIENNDKNVSSNILSLTVWFKHLVIRVKLL